MLAVLVWASHTGVAVQDCTRNAASIIRK